MEYEELSTGGMYQSWKEVGDTVEGRIEAFGLTDGTDFNDEPCPQMIVGTADGNVIINAGQASLRRAFMQNATRLAVGHGVKITYAGDYETPKGSGKSFTVAVSPKPIAPIVVELTDDAEPF